MMPTGTYDLFHGNCIQSPFKKAAQSQDPEASV